VQGAFGQSDLSLNKESISSSGDPAFMNMNINNNSSYTISSKSTVEVKGSINLSGELIVKGTLIIHGNVSLSNKSKFIVESTGNLILSGRNALNINGPQGKGAQYELAIDGQLTIENSSAINFLANYSFGANSKIVYACDIKNVPNFINSNSRIYLSANKTISTAIDLNLKRLILLNGATFNLNNTLTVENIESSGAARLNLESNGYIILSSKIDGKLTIRDAGNGIRVTGKSSILADRIEIKNLTIADQAGLSLFSPITVSRKLKLETNAVLETREMLTLTKGAYLDKVEVGASVAGPVFFEKELSAISGWRYIGTSTNNQMVSEWADDLIIKTRNQGVPNIYYYDETKGTEKYQGKDGWIYLNTPADLLKKGLGYIVNLSAANYNQGPAVIREKGNVIIGNGDDQTMSADEANFKFPLTFTAGKYDGGGWNLVANPYPAAIDWQAAGWVKTNLNNAIYVWNPVTQQYSSFLGETSQSINGGTSLIAPGQAFFVKAIAANPTLELNENAKSTGSRAIMRIASEELAQIRIGIEDQLRHRDETLIGFRSDATDAFDTNLDAYKMNGTYVNIGSVLDVKTKLSINNLAMPVQGKKVALTVQSSVKGLHTLNFSISNLDIYQVKLVDKFLKKEADLEEATTYTFEINSDPASAGESRFELVLSEKVILFLENKMAAKNSLIEVPVKAINFSEKLTAQFGLSWNPEKLQYNGIIGSDLTSLQASHFNETLKADGKLKFAWDQSDLIPQSLQDSSKLFVLSFSVLATAGDTALINFDQSALVAEVAGVSFKPEPLQLIDGFITVQKTKTIAGTVKNQIGVSLENIKVQYQGTQLMDTLTKADGNYAFEVEAGTSGILSASGDQGVSIRAGVTTLDILLIRRHILGIQSFQNPLQNMAADVNLSGTITTLDIATMRQVILGMSDQFPAGKIFEYVADANLTTTVQTLNDSVNYDFTAVKLGDVNNSWTPAGGRIARANGFVLEFEALAAKAGSELKVPVKVSDFKDIAGFQFTMSWDKNLYELVKVEGNGLNISFNQARISEGKLSAQWDQENTEGISLSDGSDLFNLVFAVKQLNGQALQIDLTNELTESMAVGKGLQHLSLEARMIVPVAPVMPETKLQVYPNPVEAGTNVSFFMKEAGKAEISILDIQGRLIDKISQNADAGLNQVYWNRDQATRIIEPGIYLLQLNRENNLETLRIQIR
jgi:hypothetical protein